MSSSQEAAAPQGHCSKSGQLKFLLFFTEVIAAGMSALCIYKCPYQPQTEISQLLIITSAVSLTGIFASFFFARKHLLIFFVATAISIYGLMIMAFTGEVVGGCDGHTRECYQLDDEDDEKDDDDGLMSSCEPKQVRNDDDSDFSDGTFLAVKCLKDKVCDVNCGEMHWCESSSLRTLY